VHASHDAKLKFKLELSILVDNLNSKNMAHAN